MTQFRNVLVLQIRLHVHALIYVQIINAQHVRINGNPIRQTQLLVKNVGLYTLNGLILRNGVKPIKSD